MKNIDSMKDRLYSLRHGNLFRLGERFPQVTRVLVIYKAKSGSWDGRETEGKIELNSDMLLNALVECPNATCTGIGIDLNNEVSAAQCVATCITLQVKRNVTVGRMKSVMESTNAAQRFTMTSLLSTIKVILNAHKDAVSKL